MTKTVYRTLFITGAAVLTFSPAAIAISGSATHRSAAAAQYGLPTPTPVPTVQAVATPTVEVKPTVTSNPPEATTTPGGPTTPPGGQGNPPSSPPTTLEQGTSTPSSQSLPFTGGPVLPLVLGALVLLGAGAVLRRASGPRSSD